MGTVTAPAADIVSHREKASALLCPGLLGTPRGFIGNTNRDCFWRLGGIVISCVADIPFIEAFNGPIPTGRFLC